MAPRSWVELTTTDVHSFVRFRRGDHVAVQEEPDVVADDICAFFRQLR